MAPGWLTNLTNRVMPILRYELGDRITVNPEPCTCGSSLPAIRVEGRTDEVLRFRTTNGESIPVLPLALWSVLKETPGVLRFQAIQTAPDALKIRIGAKHAEEDNQVWQMLHVRAQEYLAHQGLGNVSVARAIESPQRDPKSGKIPPSVG